MSDYRFEWRVCRRPFLKPLQTAKGEWRERVTLIVRLDDENGRHGYGEVAPLESFGSESVDYAAQCLRTLGARQDLTSMLRIVPQFRATRFGLLSAFADLQGWTARDQEFSRAVLLNLDAAAEEGCRRAAADGFSLAKIKIGSAAPEWERERLRLLIKSLPNAFRLRLDANGSMDLQTLEAWAEDFSGESCIECLEQPLPPDLSLQQAQRLKVLHRRLPLALDESVSSAPNWQHWVQDLGWPGLLVLKPSVFGSLDECRQAIKGQSERIILSSAFESLVGLRSLLRLAAEFELKRPLGLGTVDYFAEQVDLFGQVTVHSEVLKSAQMDALWESLSKKGS